MAKKIAAEEVKPINVELTEQVKLAQRVLWEKVSRVLQKPLEEMKEATITVTADAITVKEKE